VAKFVFLLLLWLKYFQNEVEKVAFSRQIYILLVKRFSSVAGLEYTMLYGKSQVDMIGGGKKSE